MTALHLTVADSVAAALNGHTFTGKLQLQSVKRRVLPLDELVDFLQKEKTGKVIASVFVMRKQSSLQTRRTFLREIDIAVTLSAKVNRNDPASTDPVEAIGDEVESLLELSTHGTMPWVGNARTLFLEEHLADGVLTTYVVATFRRGGIS